MRWKGRRQSSNVDDRRRMSVGGKVAGGGIGILVLAVVVALLGGDVSQFLGGGESGFPVGGLQGGAPPTAAEDELAQFISVVLADTEDVWNEVFRSMGKQYREPKLVLYRDRVQTGGGAASASMGPFYMPEDETIYIDLGFFEEMKRRFKAPGDFAQAYVLAHEVGHHVEKLLGILDRVDGSRDGLSEAENNRMSVRVELQADFFAGLWAHHAQRMRNILEEGDVEEALAAASAIGDDRLQKQTRGYAVPDSFTHGTSAQRVAWFKHGLRTGKLSEGDTFDEATWRKVNPN